MTIEVVKASDRQALDELRQLLRDYAVYVRAHAGEDHLCLTAYEAELAGIEEVYCLMLIARSEDGVAGCALLKHLGNLGGEMACEMKRLWVPIESRGHGLGHKLTERLITEARRLDFRAMYLDTIPERMPEAFRLYQTLGFEPVAPYNDNRIAGVQHFRLAL